MNRRSEQPTMISQHRRETFAKYALQRMPTLDNEKFIAGKLGITPDAIRAWKKGKSTPRLKLIPLLAELWQCQESEILHMVGSAYQDIGQYNIYKSTCGLVHTCAKPPPVKVLGRNGRLKSLSKEDRAAHDRNLRRASRKRENKCRAPSLRMLLRTIKWRVGDIRRRVIKWEKMWERHTLIASYPWIKAGFRSREVWQKETPEGREHRRLMWQVRSKGHKSQIRKRIRGTFKQSEWLAIIKAWGYCCAYCSRHRTEFRDRKRREDIEMDHIVPIGHPQSRHDGSNIVPACKSCNASKGDSDLASWSARSGIRIPSRLYQMESASLAQGRHIA